MLFAAINFMRDESRAIIFRETSEKQIVGRVCLHKHTSREGFATCTTTDLREQLEGTFTRAKFTTIKPHITIHHDH